MLTRRSMLRLAALAPLVSVTCAHAQTASDADWKKVVEAAKKEGKVVVYNGAVGTPTLPKVAAAFEARYGIRMELLEARASELRERIRTEQAAGKVLGDVSHNGSTTTTLQVAENTFQPHGALPNAKRPAPPFAVDEMRIPIYVIPYGLLINTDMVKPADEPKTWNDLLDPKWKGKILADDMRALGGGAVFFMVMTQKFGKEFHEKLAMQQPHMNRDLRGNYPRIARGEYPLYVPYTLPDILELKGLPVKAILPPEGQPYVRFDGAIFKGAPRPNAARVFLDFLLSDEGQLCYGSLGFFMVVGGLEGRIAPEPRAIIQSVKLLGTTDPKLQEDMLKLAKQIYK
jgi:iron(III) transport system substrate-binding protein